MAWCRGDTKPSAASLARSLPSATFTEPRDSHAFHSPRPGSLPAITGAIIHLLPSPPPARSTIWHTRYPPPPATGIAITCLPLRARGEAVVPSARSLAARRPRAFQLPHAPSAFVCALPSAISSNLPSSNSPSRRSSSPTRHSLQTCSPRQALVPTRGTPSHACGGSDQASSSDFPVPCHVGYWILAVLILLVGCKVSLDPVSSLSLSSPTGESMAFLRRSCRLRQTLITGAAAANDSLDELHGTWCALGAALQWGTASWRCSLSPTSTTLSTQLQLMRRWGTSCSAADHLVSDAWRLDARKAACPSGLSVLTNGHHYLCLAISQLTGINNTWFPFLQISISILNSQILMTVVNPMIQPFWWN